MASRVGSQAAQLAVFLVAARYLSPADFGVFSLFFAFQVLISQLVQLGWPEFVASWEGASEVDAQAFTMAALGGVGAALLGTAGAVVVLAFPKVAPYAFLQLLLSLPLAGVGITAVLEGWLLRSGRGAALAKLVLISEISGAAAAIFGLTQGWEVISLGVGKLVSQSLLALGSVATARWFPGLRLRGPGTRDIIIYQRNLLVSKLMWYLEQYAGVLALGLFLGPHAVGLYRAAERVVGAVAELVFAPARVVCWMTLRPVVDFESPDKAVASLISVMSVVMPPLFSLRQQSGQVLRLSLVMGVVCVAALFSLAPFGVIAAAWGEVVAASVIAAAVGNAFVKVAGVNVLRAVLSAFPSFVGSFLMAMSLWALSNLCGTLTGDVRLQLGLEIALGTLVFLLVFTLLGGWPRLARLRIGFEPPGKPQEER